MENEAFEILRDNIKKHIQMLYGEAVNDSPELRECLPIIVCNKNIEHLLFQLDTHSPIYYINSQNGYKFERFLRDTGAICIGVLDNMYVIYPTKDYPAKEIEIYFI